MTPRPHVLEELDRPPEPMRANWFAGIVPSQTALVSVDLQNAFVREGMPAYVPAAHATIAPTTQIAAALRAAGGLVVHTRHSVTTTGPQAPPIWQLENPTLRAAFETMRPGTEAHQLAPDIPVEPQDWVIDKYRYSAFLPISSTLDVRLRERGIDTVIITGTLTNVCCESSARDAHMLGYRVFFVADATAALTDIDHNATLRSMAAIFADVRLADELVAMIGEHRQSSA